MKLVHIPWSMPIRMRPYQGLINTGEAHTANTDSIMLLKAECIQPAKADVLRALIFELFEFMASLVSSIA